MHAKFEVFIKLLLPVLVCLTGYQLPGAFYRNLGAVELVHAVDVSKPAYIADGVLVVHDLSLKRSIDYLHQSFVLDSESLSTIRLIAMTAAVQGDWGKVAQMAPFITRLSPSDTMGNLLLGYAYWRMDRVADNLQAWRQAKAASFLCDRAAIYQRAGKGAEAIELYTLARQVDPNVSPQIESRVDIAWALYFSGRKDEAFAELSAGLNYPRQEDWQKIIARGEMGMYYLREGQWQHAIEYYQGALALGPGRAQYRLWMGRAYMELGELDLAERELLQTVRDATVGDIGATAHFFLGQLYARRGQSDQSVDAYAQAVKLSPNNLEFHLYLARAYSNAGRKELALEEWKAIVAMYPDDPQLRAWYEEAKLK